jgi:methionyl-tRNA formyltransferase
VILQAELPIETDETADSLAERLLPLEHKIYVDAIRTFTQEESMKTADRALRDVVIPGRAPDYRGRSAISTISAPSSSSSRPTACRRTT